MTYAKFPNLRMRRLRQNSNILSLVQENNLETTDLIWPIFITDETNKMVEIKSMPGVYCYSLDGIIKQAEKADLNIVVIEPKSGYFTGVLKSLITSNKTILVINKSDLGVDIKFDEFKKLNPIYISLKNETNVNKLTYEIRNR